ncbi:hypothetical protein CAPTEDRAFT_151190 [Capitella teleta]|uniref:JNK1/MAPK8-associated membrane protein n=1 Tax=Capitella teleta TaxID=283909 RepID=R7U9W2_CAPTE|nr:hypothetical protein CAPTEDRAFT_151190 [Capitella teleta]|eukprot:ELU02906.1 hypothetical protein CAPTEDRAFT_151190 [Capitella teleta]
MAPLFLTLSLSILIFPVHSNEIVIEPSKCPGEYCGRVLDSIGNYSDCMACPRSWRPDEHSICQKCSEDPGFYDWLYLGFMFLIAPALHCFFIDFTNKRKNSGLIVLHISALLECSVAAIVCLTIIEPVGSLNIRSCRVQHLADWYTMLYNPSPDYINTLHCTQEAVYPLYTIVMIYYALDLLCMMLARPLLSAKFVNNRGTKSIYAALYFIPVLIVSHAVLAGLIYYSFPYIVLVVSIVTNATHFAFFKEQSMMKLFLDNVKDPRNIAILLCHWLLHAFGIVAVTQLQQPTFHAPFLCLIPFPALFYLMTVKFTDPQQLDNAGG